MSLYIRRIVRRYHRQPYPCVAYRQSFDTSRHRVAPRKVSIYLSPCRPIPPLVVPRTPRVPIPKNHGFRSAGRQNASIFGYLSHPRDIIMVMRRYTSPTSLQTPSSYREQTPISPSASTTHRSSERKGRPESEHVHELYRQWRRRIRPYTPLTPRSGFPKQYYRHLGVADSP